MRSSKRVLILTIVMLFFFTAVIPIFTSAERETLNTRNDGNANVTRSANWKAIGEISKTIEIPAGETYYVYFDEITGTLKEKSINYDFDSLPQAAKDAIGMVPKWLKANLTRKLIELDNAHATTYGNLIKSVNEPLQVDEVAFAIAHTGKTTLQNNRVFPDMFKTNAKFIYENDQYLDYVNITEINDPELGAYTTLIYTNKTGHQLQLPMEVYYWYVVHPKISDELPSFVNPDGVQGTAQEFQQPPTGVFWREFLFHHNDSGYPLLKDRLAGVGDVWRAARAVSGWVVGSMAFTSDNERAIEPVRIYRKHIGRCGEHQDIACAAARAALIPNVPTSNMAEDHVWNEFWDGRWVHWDANSANNMDRCFSHDKDYSGGKDLSTVWSWDGDGRTWSVTNKYTPTCNYTAFVQDADGNPVDSAGIWVLTENYYDPQSLTWTTWGTTNASGYASFELGNVRNYWSSAETEALGEDPPDQGGGERVVQVISGAQIGGSYTRSFTLPNAFDLPSMVSRPPDPSPAGRFRMDIDYNVTNAIYSGENLFTRDVYYVSDPSGSEIDFFMCNGTNFAKYGADDTFDAYEISDDGSFDEISYLLPKDENWYAILSNEDSLGTLKVVNVTATLFRRPDLNVLSPSDESTLGLNEIITIQGAATSPFITTNVEIKIDDDDWVAATDTSDGSEDPWTTWEYSWDTEGAGLGQHRIGVRSTDSSGQITAWLNVTLVDVTSPELSITSPGNNSQFKVGTKIFIEGSASDNVHLSSVEIMVEDNPTVDITSNYNGETWEYTWDTAFTFPGTYDITINVEDGSENQAMDMISILLVESTDPMVEISSPWNNSVYAVGEEILILGTAVDSSGVIVVEAILDGNKEEIINLSRYYSNNQWHMKLDTEELELEEGSHNISIQARDAVSNIGTTGITFHLDATAPVGLIKQPENNSIFSSTEKISLWGEGSDNFKISLIEIVFDDIDNVQNPPINITSQFDEENDYWEFDYYPAEGIQDRLPLSSGLHSIYLRLVDSVGFDFMSEPITVIIDAESPSVSFHEFNIPLSYEEYLSKGSVEDELIDAFGTYGGITLGSEAELSKYKNSWQLEDDDKEYRLVLTEYGLHVYDDDPAPVLLGETVWINGSAGDDVGISKIEISIDGEAPIDITSSFQNGIWSYRLNSAGHDPGYGNITVQVIDVKDRITMERKTVEFISTSTDTDGDGMPDWWEMKFGLERTSSDGSRNPDGDKANNLKEYLGHDGKPGNDDWTDPTDKTSSPGIGVEGAGTGSDDVGGSVTLIMIIIILGIVLVVGVVIIALVLVLKKRGKKRFENKAYAMWSDPKLNAHETKERFKMDPEEKTTSVSDDEPKPEIKTEDLDDGGEMKIEALPDLALLPEISDIEAGETSKPDGGHFGGRMARMPARDRGPTKNALSSVEVLPAHLKSGSTSGKPPVCSRCGTSSKYYSDHDCYWCESCLDYVSGSDEGESDKSVVVKSTGSSDLKPAESKGSKSGAVVRRRVVRKKIVR